MVFEGYWRNYRAHKQFYKFLNKLNHREDIARDCNINKIYWSYAYLQIIAL